MRICLMTEGTYPFVRGGVSTWCQSLIAGLPEVEFTVYALTGSIGGCANYLVPANVSRVIRVPLWGHDGVREYNARDRGPNGTRQRSSSALHAQFIPAFCTLVGETIRGMRAARPHVVAHTLASLYLFFQTYDYDWALRHRATWEAALATLSEAAWFERRATIAEASEFIRSLYRYLLPLAIELPTTDIMHTSAAGLCAIPAIVGKIVRGDRVLLTEHGIYLRERAFELARGNMSSVQRILRKNFFAAIGLTAYACSDLITPVCRYNTTWERYYGVPADRIVVVPNGVDHTRFFDADQTPEVPTVSAIMRIDPLKDVVTLIASAVATRARVPNVRYDIWGPAPDPNYLAYCQRVRAELAVGDIVHFRGPTTDVPAALADSHVAVLSSISEGMPYTIIEALMSGKPVVATDVGGCREIVGRFGSIVPPKQPQRLGNALADLLLDPLHARSLGKAGRLYALERFTEQAFLSRYREIYAGLQPCAERAA